MLHVRDATASDVDAIAHVHVSSWNAAYRGIMPDEEIDARTIEVRRAQWESCLKQRDRVTLVACDDAGTVQGFASALLLDGSDQGFFSYLQTLYLLPEARRGGIGRALLAAIAARLRESGIRNMALRVIRRSPARAFAADDGLFDDVVYAFDDLAAI